MKKIMKMPASWLFFFVFITYGYFYPGGGHNEAARYDTLRAVLHERRFIVDSFAYNSADLISKDGHYYSSKAPGTFILGLPVMAVLEFFFKWLPISSELKDHWICYLTSLLTVGLLGALGAVLLYQLSLRWCANQAQSVGVALAISLGTIYFPFSTLFFSHVPSAVFVLFGFYQFFAFSQENLGQEQRSRLWQAGASLAFSIVLEYPSAIAVVITLIYGYFILRARGVSRSDQALVVVGFLGGILPLFIYNYLSFRSLFYIPYQAYATDAKTAFVAHKKGVLGVHIPFLEPAFWPQFFSNLAEITFRPLRGIFVANPLLVLIFPGYFLWFRQNGGREALYSLILTLAYFGFNASYGDSIVYWGGGASFGPRHLLGMLPLLALPLLWVLQTRWGQILFGILSLFSVIICTLVTSIEPRTPYYPPHPLKDFYLPLFLQGRLAMTAQGIFSNTFVTSNSVAFNWGALLGLKGVWQLWPLLLFWMAMAWMLDRSLGLRLFFVVSCLCFLCLGIIPLMWHVSS